MRHAILPDPWGVRVSRVAQALTAVGALDDKTARIEVIASGRSAQAHTILPVRWQASRPAT